MNTQRAIEIAFPAHKAPFEVGHRPRGPLDRQAVRIDIVPDRATLRLLRDRRGRDAAMPVERSEEHTSELQSLMRISYAVLCLKKKKRKTHRYANLLMQTTTYVIQRRKSIQPHTAHTTTT